MSGETTKHSRHAVRLVFATVAIAFIWMAILPWIARMPAVSNYIAHLEQADVDPSAMYYTDLEAAKPILTRMALKERLPKN